MRYCQSLQRREFEERIKHLQRNAKFISQRRINDDVQKMVFQCSICLTGAATETYLKIVVSSYLFNVRKFAHAAHAPASVKTYIAVSKLTKIFSRFAETGDESSVCAALEKEPWLWALLSGSGALPVWLDPNVIHEGVSYPSKKNITRLFSRLGVHNVIDRLNRHLSRDVEVLIDEFQGVRTALAHSAPPDVTFNDVLRLLKGSVDLVGGLDQIFFAHVMIHGGFNCWPR